MAAPSGADGAESVRHVVSEDKTSDVALGIGGANFMTHNSLFSSWPMILHIYGTFP